MGSYPPGVTQWHIDYYAGGYDEPPPEEPDESDYDHELDWLSLMETYR